MTTRAIRIGGGKDILLYKDTWFSTGMDLGGGAFSGLGMRLFPEGQDAVNVDYVGGLLIQNLSLYQPLSGRDVPTYIALEEQETSILGYPVNDTEGCILAYGPAIYFSRNSVGNILIGDRTSIAENEALELPPDFPISIHLDDAHSYTAELLVANVYKRILTELDIQDLANYQQIEGYKDQIGGYLGIAAETGNVVIPGNTFGANNAAGWIGIEDYNTSSTPMFGLYRDPMTSNSSAYIYVTGEPIRLLSTLDVDLSLYQTIANRGITYPGLDELGSLLIPGTTIEICEDEDSSFYLYDYTLSLYAVSIGYDSTFGPNESFAFRMFLNSGGGWKEVLTTYNLDLLGVEMQENKGVYDTVSHEWGGYTGLDGYGNPWAPGAKIILTAVNSYIYISEFTSQSDALCLGLDINGGFTGYIYNGSTWDEILTDDAGLEHTANKGVTGGYAGLDNQGGLLIPGFQASFSFGIPQIIGLIDSDTSEVFLTVYRNGQNNYSAYINQGSGATPYAAALLTDAPWQYPTPTGFSASGTTWSVFGVNRFAYKMLTPTTMLFSYNIASSTVGASTNALYITIPGGYSAVGYDALHCAVNGGTANGYNPSTIYSVPMSNTLVIQSLIGMAYNGSTTSWGQLVIEVYIPV